MKQDPKRNQPETGKQLRSDQTDEIIDLEETDLDDPDETQETGRKTSRTSGRSGKKTAGISGKLKESFSGKKKRKKHARNREFAIITYVFTGLFLLLMGYFIYFQVFRSEDVINNAYNPRLDLYEDLVVRGDIESADGETLATTTVSEDGTETRVYPYGSMFAHVVGYTGNGNYGIEQDANFEMLRSHSFFLKQILNDLRDEKNQGDTVVTTLDCDVQEAAYNALGDYDGAVVVLEVSTGKVIAMVSKPDFDPNTIESEWDSITSDEDSSVLLNRATQGLYPPGSTFKIVTALEYLRENGTDSDISFDCSGSIEVDGSTIHCYGSTAHGSEDLASAFANSCNSAFATIGLDLNLKKYSSLCEDLLFNQTLPTSFTTETSSFTLTEDSGTGLIMQTAIGQGETLVTPIHMAMIAAAICNDGVLMEPYVIDHIENDGGVTVDEYSSTKYGSLMTEEEAEALQTLMEGVVSGGTASALSGQSYSAAGKTGSAEYSSSSDSHAWFVGYGSKDGYEDIAIAVVVEDGGSGSSTAVPIAKQVFDVYFNQ